MEKREAKLLRRISNTDKVALIFSICTVLQKSVPFLLMPILTRKLNAEEYGLYSIYTSWVTILTVLATLNLHLGGFNNGMVNYPTQRRNYMVSIISLSIAITGGMSICCLLLNYGLQLNIIELPLKYTLLVFFQIACTQGFLCWSAKARYERDFKKLLLLTVINTVCSIILPLIALFIGMSVFGIILSVQLPNMLIGLGCYIVCLLKNQFRIDTYFWRKAVSFNVPLLPHYISGSVLSQIDRIMIQRFCGVEDTALYSVAYSLSSAINLVISSLNAAMVPDIYEALKNNSCEGIRAQLKKYIGFFSVSVMSVMLVMPEVISVIAPDDYADSIQAVPPIVLSCLFIFLYNVFANVEFYYEAKYFISAASVLAALSNVILNAIFIPSFGYYAAAYTTAVCYMLYALAHMLNARKLCWKHDRQELLEIKAVLITIAVLSLWTLFVIQIYRFWYVRYTLLIAIAAFIFIRFKKGEWIYANDKR